MTTNNESITLESLINEAVRYNLSTVHTAIPGKVTNYDNKTQRAEVQPLINQVYKDGKTEEQPVIVSVPVIFPRTKESIISLPINKGDTVLILFCEKSIDLWLSGTGKNSNPGNNRKFDLSDAIAIPGLYPVVTSSEAIDDGILIKHKGARVRLGDDNKIAIGNDQEELLDLVNEILTKVIALQIQVVGGSSSGAHSLTSTSSTDFTTLQTRLAKIKGTL